MKRQFKKLLAVIAVGLGIAGVSVATVSGYRDISNVKTYSGVSEPTDATIKSSGSRNTDDVSQLAIAAVDTAKPKEPAAPSKLKKIQGVKTIHVVTPHAPGKIPAMPLPTPEQPNCFIAEEEGIYVPIGANTGSITLTADRPVYWRTMSESITTSDAGTGVGSSFPAYIVLESPYDPNKASTSISFHLHARENAPLGEYCPKDELGQVGIAAYTEQNDEYSKIFDVPMNINVVQSLTGSQQ